MSKRYEVCLEVELLSESEKREFIMMLYKMGYQIYRGIDGQVCFTATDSEIAKINGKWVKD